MICMPPTQMICVLHHPHDSSNTIHLCFFVPIQLVRIVRSSPAAQFIYVTTQIICVFYHPLDCPNTIHLCFLPPTRLPQHNSFVFFRTNSIGCDCDRCPSADEGSRLAGAATQKISSKQRLAKNFLMLQTDGIQTNWTCIPQIIWGIHRFAWVGTPFIWVFWFGFW